MRNEIELKNATLTDVPQLYQLEITSFPSDEAATEEKISYRCENASNFFQIYFENQEILGFVNGTLISTKNIEEESMQFHDPDGRSLALHSVTVNPSVRRKGLGTKILLKYIENIKTYEQVDRILLLSKANMLEFYLKIGFVVDKLSEVEHGSVSQIIPVILS